jgi:hypothetical protein
LGIKIHNVKPLGFYEKMYRDRHDITHCFIVKSFDEIKLDHQASKKEFFKKIPKNTAPFHEKMLRDVEFR